MYEAKQTQTWLSNLAAANTLRPFIDYWGLGIIISLVFLFFSLSW